MSGLLVLFACLAVAVAIAVPTIARAAAPPTTNNPANMMRKAGGEQEEFLTITGNIYASGPAFMRKDKWIPLDLCSKLVVLAHKGSEASGPIIGRANAMPGKTPGSCVYSLKVPTAQNVTVGIQSFSWGASKLSPNDYLKLDQLDKTSWTWQKQATGEWLKAGLNGDGFNFLKLDYKELKLDYKEAKLAPSSNVPLYVKLSPAQ